MNAKSVLAIVAALACLSAVPAITAVHHTGSIDGSATITCGRSTMLFGGAVPPNGFMVQLDGGSGPLIVNDNGPAFLDTGVTPISIAGFQVGPIFVTPPAYKPMGPVSVLA
jgi:hypothetical protein